MSSYVSAKPEPAVPVRRSVSPDQIICLICGKKQKLLKRHLAVAHGLTPDQYREQFGLKPDYPTVAPNYARARSELALRIGLGRPKQPARPGKRAAPVRIATEQTPAKRPQGKPAAAKRVKRVPAAAE